MTLNPGTLIVARACPDLPFELKEDGIATGFDIQLIHAICSQMELTLQRERYLGADFDGIFPGMENHTYDAVISGTTITPDRAETVLFSQPYLVFNQGVAVNRRITPKASAAVDFHGLTAGIKSGNTSEAVARTWLAQGAIAASSIIPTTA